MATETPVPLKSEMIANKHLISDDEGRQEGQPIIDELNTWPLPELIPGTRTLHCEIVEFWGIVRGKPVRDVTVPYFATCRYTRPNGETANIHVPMALYYQNEDGTYNTDMQGYQPVYNFNGIIGGLL